MARCLAVPEQGSPPNCVLPAVTEHEGLPTHAAPTTAVLSGALHAPTVYEGHVPVDVPKEAKSTDVMTWPTAGHASVATAFSPADAQSSYSVRFVRGEQTTAAATLLWTP